MSVNHDAKGRRLPVVSSATESSPKLRNKKYQLDKRSKNEDFIVILPRTFLVE